VVLHRLPLQVRPMMVVPAVVQRQAMEVEPMMLPPFDLGAQVRFDSNYVELCFELCSVCCKLAIM
jgi:hypothetical protein